MLQNKVMCCARIDVPIGSFFTHFAWENYNDKKEHLLADVHSFIPFLGKMRHQSISYKKSFFSLPTLSTLSMNSSLLTSNITLPWWESGGNFDPKLTKSGKNQPIHRILYCFKSVCCNKMRKLRNPEALIRIRRPEVRILPGAPYNSKGSRD